MVDRPGLQIVIMCIVAFICFVLLIFLCSLMLGTPLLSMGGRRFLAYVLVSFYKKKVKKNNKKK